MPLIQRFEGFDIWESDGHGKRVKGKKKTSTIQVRSYGATQGGFMLLKQFSFPVIDLVKRQRAIDKAKKFIEEQLFLNLNH